MRPGPDLSAAIEAVAAGDPGRPALRFAGKAWSYGDLAAAVERTAAALSGPLGLKPGDRIAYLGLNRPEMLFLIFAAARLGLVLVPLNWRLAPPEHAFVLDHAGAAVVFAERRFAEALPAGGRPVVAVDEAGPGSFAALLAAAGATPPRSGSPEAPLLVVYTSGTTGRPKGAVLTQAALACNAANAVAMHAMTADDRILTVLPMFHVGGLNIQTTPALMLGAEVTLHDRFDPGAFLDAVAAEAPTLTVLVPATMAALVAHPRFEATPLASLRAVATGSMVVPTELIEAFHRRGVPVIQVYGASETAPVAIHQTIARARDTVGSIGRVAAHTAVRLVDRDGRDVAPGEAGEILVRGEHVAAGYWNDPQASAAAFADGWFRSGDIAVRDESGDYWFKDRIKNVIISGGENIYPAEAERILREIPGVRECCVVGRPDPRWGAVPVAVVVADDPAPSPEAILAAFEGRLARFKRPRDVVMVEALPKSALGKVRVDEVMKLVTPAGRDPAEERGPARETVPSRRA